MRWFRPSAGSIIIIAGGIGESSPSSLILRSRSSSSSLSSCRPWQSPSARAYGSSCSSSIIIGSSHSQRWRHLLSHPWDWLDIRHHKTRPDQPDFRHRASGEALWLTSWYKPPWVDACLPTLFQEYSQGHAFHNRLQTLCDYGQLTTAVDLLASHLDRAFTDNIDLYICLLKACSQHKSLAHASRVSVLLSRKNLPLAGPLADHLIAALARCGALDDAQSILGSLPYRSVYSWNAIISGYTACGCGKDSLIMYQRMLAEGIEPDQHTFVNIFKACTLLLDLKGAEELFADALKKGFSFNVFAGSALLTMYGKCGNILEAEHVFIQLSDRNVVSWSALLTAYLEHGYELKVLWLYRQMQQEGVGPNESSFLISLQACGILAVKEVPIHGQVQLAKVASLEIGRALHADALREEFSLDCHVHNTVVSMYGKCGSLSEAENAFNELTEPDIVTWTAMLSTYVEHGQEQKALELYSQMLHEGVCPDQQAFVIALQGCLALAEGDEATAEGLLVREAIMEVGQALHADAQRTGLTLDDFVGSTLVTLYGTCGKILEAEIVFESLTNRDIVSWSAMLAAYVEHGEGEKALNLYGKMIEDGMTLDDVTITSALEACRATGSLDLCKEIHFIIIAAGYDDNLILGRGLLQAYGDCTRMVDARAVFDTLPERDVTLWTACIGGYAQEGNNSSCLRMFEEMQTVGVRPSEITFLLLLSACSRAGLVEKGVELFESMSRDYMISPNLKHYASIVDLLGRAGDFKRLEHMLQQIQVQANLGIWMCVLGACRTHGNVELGKRAFFEAVNLNPKEAGPYILMSNIYSDAGLQEHAMEIENMRLKEGAWLNLDLWIDHNQRVCVG